MQIENSKVTLQDAVTQATADIILQLSNIKKDISDVNDTVVTYDRYRAYGFIAIFALAFFIVFIYFLTLVTRSPNGSKRCGISSSIYWIPLFLLALILFVIALIVGESMHLSYPRLD